ncbi:MAG TPA: efflux RND transporter periplasmic adaptor subunit [Flavipsychrobacter sp.]|nr:efflux RND transporter periplasmic adaptor subunit [Flavipsychrobacter sp.]
MKKILLYSALTLVAIVLIFWKLNDNKKKNAAKTAIVKESSSGAVPVLTQQVRVTSFDPQFIANGNFEPVREINFLSEISGRITSLSVKEGSKVGIGSILARVDNEVLNAELQSSRSSLEQARLDRDRFIKAFETGGVTQKQVDDMKLQYATAEARYTAARRKVEDTYIKSPISGTINNKFVEVGTYLTAGTKMFEIVDISHLKLVVNVPEAQVVQLSNGQEVNVTTNVFPEVVYKGKVTFIAAKGDASLNYPVEIEVSNVSGRELKAGMYGTANFQLPEQPSMMLIPRSAFYGGVNSNTIFVLENGKAVTKKVVSGRVMGDKVEIRSGLSVGETVITSGQVNLVDGTAVTIQKSNNG